MTLSISKDNLFFVAYYYLYVFKGGYPLNKNNNDIIIRHFIHNYLGVKSVPFEIDLTNILKKHKKGQIKEKAYSLFPLLKKRVDTEDRILLIANTLAHIKREANKPIERPRYLDPDHYKLQTGKQFRMTADQVERNLSREEAFDEFVRGLKK